MSGTNEGRSAGVVVVGGGLAGLATALGCALRGLDVTVLEAADQVGGAAAYSGGMVWAGGTHVAAREGIEDSLEQTEKYVRAIASHSRPDLLDETAMKRWMTVAPEAIEYWESVGAIRWEVIPGLSDYHSDAEGSLDVGRYLTGAVFDGDDLGEWRSRLRVSPYFPVGSTYADMLARGRRSTTVTQEDEGTELASHAGAPAFGMAGGEHRSRSEDAGDPLTFGTGVVAAFLARVLKEDRVRILLEHRVSELLRDDQGRVVGARATSPEGTSEHHGDVVLATSSYDWDKALVREILEVDPENFGSVAPESIRGDGITLARSVGGFVDRLPATAVPMVPGWRLGSDTEFGYGPEFALPHSMMVDSAGNRFCDDSYWVSIVGAVMKPGSPHLPFYLIWDEQHHRKYGLGATAPGADYPEGVVTSADTLADLGRALGIDPDQLERTAAEFSKHAEQGEDPHFGRGTSEYILSLSGDRNQKPNGLLGTIVEPPFHGFRLRVVGTGIGTSGVAVDSECRVVDGDRTPIPGLYAAGSVASMTAMGTGYNSGFALSRCVTHAYQIATRLGGAANGVGA